MKNNEKHKLPDFIIIGAMKSGTTSIHHILSQHDKVFIPTNEINFFNLDDIDQHGNYFIKTSKGWTFHDFEADFETYFEWYKQFFQDAGADQIIGEDTTTYIASPKAPARIAELLPQVKLIAMLRDPVTRAYSHYWHNVDNGRATMNFDKTIQFQGGNYLSRGYYEEQLLRYESFIKQGRLKVVFFEDFVADTQSVTDDLCNYLGLTKTIDITKVDTHQNASSGHLVIPLRLFGNLLYTVFLNRKSYINIPNMPTYKPDMTTTGKKKKPFLQTMWQTYSGLMPKRKYPPMNPDTKQFLHKLYRKKNAGLSKLIGQDVSARWNYMSDKYTQKK